MKTRLAALLLSVLLSVPLTGCTAVLPRALDLAEVEMARTMGVDREDGQLKITMATGMHMREENTSDPLILSARADTVTNACLQLQNGAAHTLSYSHITDVLFSEEAAREGIHGPLDYLTGEFDLRLSTRVFLVEDAAAEDAIRSVSSEKGDIAGHLQTLSRDINYGSPGFEITTLEVENWLEDNNTMLMPVVSVEEEAVDCIGLCYFDGDKLSGILTEEASRGAGLILDQVRQQSVELHTDGVATAVVVEQIDCGLTPDWERKVILVHLTGDASVRETGDVHLLDEDQRGQLEKEAEQTLAAQIRAALDAAQLSGLDFLHLRRSLAARAPWDAAWIQAAWEELYPQLSYEIDVQITIMRGSESNA